jgi:hypothetical protein
MKMDSGSEEMLRYIVYKNDGLVETNSEDYEAWMETTWNDIKLPIYVLKLGNRRYTVESMFQGALDKSEGDFPFIVLYFEDMWVDEAGEAKVAIDGDSFYFADIYEWKDCYENLVNKLIILKENYGS